MIKPDESSSLTQKHLQRKRPRFNRNRWRHFGFGFLVTTMKSTFVSWLLFCSNIYKWILAANKYCTFWYITLTCKNHTRSFEIYRYLNSTEESSNVRWVATESHRRGRLIQNFFETFAKYLIFMAARHDNWRNWFVRLKIGMIQLKFKWSSICNCNSIVFLNSVWKTREPSILQ